MKKITKKNIKNYEKLLIEFETIYYKLESFIFDWFSEITGEKEDIISFDVRNGKIRIEIWNDELIQILGVNELDENFYEFDLNFFNKVNQAYLKKHIIAV